MRSKVLLTLALAVNTISLPANAEFTQADVVGIHGLLSKFYQSLSPQMRAKVLPQFKTLDSCFRLELNRKNPVPSVKEVEDVQKLLNPTDSFMIK